MSSGGLGADGGLSRKAARRPLADGQPSDGLSDDQVFAHLLRTQPDRALAEAYRRHAAWLHDRVGRWSNDSALSDDVVQDVLFRLCERPEAYDPARGSLRAFLAVEARCRLIDRQRSDGARRRREGRRHEIVDAAGSDTLALAGLDRQAVDDALRALVAPERECIVLAFFGGRTYREVAKELGIAEGTAKSRIRAGLRQLRAELIVNGRALETE